MAQVKLLKISSDGVPLEFASGSDEITLVSGKFGNVKAAGNSVTSEDTNGNLNLTPNGTGNLVLDGVNWPQADGSANFFLKTNGSGQTSWAAPEATIVANSYTADESLLIRDALYISAADNVSKAIADGTAASFLLGFAQAAAADTASVNVVSEGVMGGFTGLTAGARYYLSDSAAGEITATIPSASGKTIVQAGYAKSTTALQIKIQQLGRRA